jgi:Spy/CpxP family protein refolding chaperone
MHLKTLALILLVAAATFPLPGQSQAPEGTATPSGGSHEHHHWRHHQAWFWKKLNLTESQRTYIKQLRQNNKTAIQPALLLVLKDRQALQQAITGNDAGTIASAATKLGTDQGALISARGTLHAQILNYIMASGTAEQKNLLNEWQQKNATRLQDKISRLSSNSGS